MLLQRGGDMGTPDGYAKNTRAASAALGSNVSSRLQAKLSNAHRSKKKDEDNDNELSSSSIATQQSTLVQVCKVPACTLAAYAMYHVMYRSIVRGLQCDD